MAAHSAAKAVNSQEITERARRQLLQLLESVRGKKNLVIERSLAGTVGLFVKFSTLQEYGVDKVFFLENQNVDSSLRNVVFLVRGERAAVIRAVGEQINLIRATTKIDHTFTLILTPRRTRVSDLVLEESNVLGEINILEFPLYFIPLEPDLLSLELDTAFRDLYLRKDPTCIFASAKALMGLQKTYGLFPRILGKGDNAKKVADLLVRMRNEEDVDASSDPSNASAFSSFGMTPSAVIENLIIIDREVDYLTPLATQLTYEGLIDETFSIKNNQVEIDSSILGSTPTPQLSSTSNGSTQPPTPATKRKVQLDSTDKLYPSLRDLNFSTLGAELNRTARRLESDQQSMHNKDQTIADLKNVVSKLPSYQASTASLKVHTSLAEEIMKVTRGEIFGRALEVQQNLLAGNEGSTVHETIEELIAREVPLSTVLRLLCLESCTNNGLRLRDLESFKRQILNAYGFQHMITLSNLAKMGLLVPRESHRGYLNPISGSAGQTATDWNSVRKALGLWIEEEEGDERSAGEKEDVSFAFSGYAPLSVRLVQAVLQKSYLRSLSTTSTSTSTTQPASTTQGPAGWSGFEDTLSRIRGATVDLVQKGSNTPASAARKSLRGSSEGPKTTLVFFLGGVTYAEIAALRLVGMQVGEAGGRRMLIGTTSIVGGEGVVGGAVEKGGFGN